MKTDLKLHYLKSDYPIAFELHWGIEFTKRAATGKFAALYFYFLHLPDRGLFIRPEIKPIIRDNKQEIMQVVTLWIRDMLIGHAPELTSIQYANLTIETSLEKFNPEGFSKQDYERIARDIKDEDLGEKLERLAGSAENDPEAELL